MSKCKALKTSEWESIFNSLMGVADGKDIVVSGSHDVSQECIQEFCTQTGLRNPSVCEWKWTEVENGEVGIYYPDILSERQLGECEGALYIYDTKDLSYGSSVAWDVAVVCETPHCIVIAIGEYYEV